MAKDPLESNKSRPASKDSIEVIREYNGRVTTCSKYQHHLKGSGSCEYIATQIDQQLKGCLY